MGDQPTKKWEASLTMRTRKAHGWMVEAEQVKAESREYVGSITESQGL